MAKLYVKIDENNLITEAKTDYFITDFQDWIEVGETNERHYTENLFDNKGVHLLKLENGAIVSRTKQEIDAAVFQQNKTDMISSINNNTLNLIMTKGFDYDGTTYGSNQIDQGNWNTLLGLKNRVPYPLSSVIKDINGEYVTVQNQKEMEDIVLAGMTMVNSYRASHKVLVDQVSASANQTELDAIIDNRT